MQDSFTAEAVAMSLDAVVRRVLQDARVRSSAASHDADDMKRVVALLNSLPSRDPDFESIPTVQSIRRLVAEYVQKRVTDTTPMSWDALRAECLAIVRSTHDKTPDTATRDGSTGRPGTSCQLLCFDDNVQVLALDASLPDSDAMHGTDATVSHEWGRLHEESIAHDGGDAMQCVERYLTLHPSVAQSSMLSDTNHTAQSSSSGPAQPNDEDTFVNAVDELLRRQASEVLARVGGGTTTTYAPWPHLSYALLCVCARSGKASKKASEVLQRLFDILPLYAKRALLQQALTLCTTRDATLPTLCLRLVHCLPDDWHALLDEEVQAVLHDVLSNLVLPHLALCSRLDETAQWLQTSWARRATLTHDIRRVFMGAPQLLTALRDGLPASHAVALLTCILPCLPPPAHCGSDSVDDGVAMMHACARDALDALVTCMREATASWPWSLQRDAVGTIRGVCATLLSRDARVRQGETVLHHLREGTAMTQESTERNVMLLAALLVPDGLASCDAVNDCGGVGVSQLGLLLAQLDEAVWAEEGWLRRCASTRRGARVLRSLWRRVLPRYMTALPHTVGRVLHTTAATSPPCSSVAVDDLVTLSRSLTGWRRVHLWLTQNATTPCAVDYTAILHALLSARGDDEDAVEDEAGVESDAARITATAASPQTQLTCDTIALLMRWCSCAVACAGLLRAVTLELAPHRDVDHTEWLLYVPVETFASCSGTAYAMMSDDGARERTTAAAREVRAVALLQRVRLLLWLLRPPPAHLSGDTTSNDELRAVMDQIRCLITPSRCSSLTSTEADTLCDPSAPFADDSLLVLLQCATLRTCMTPHTMQAWPRLTDKESSMLRDLYRSRRGPDPVMLLAAWLAALSDEDGSMFSAMQSWLPGVLLDGFTADVAEKDMAACAALLSASSTSALLPTAAAAAAATDSQAREAPLTRARQLVTRLWPHLCRADVDLLLGCVVMPLLSCAVAEPQTQGDGVVLQLLRCRSEVEWLTWLDTPARVGAIWARIQEACSDVAAVLRQGGVDLYYVVTLCLTCWLCDTRPSRLPLSCNGVSETYVQPTDCTLRRSLLIFAHEGLTRWEQCVAHSLVQLVSSVRATLCATATSGAPCDTPHCTRVLPLPSALYVGLVTTPFILQCPDCGAPNTAS